MAQGPKLRERAAACAALRDSVSPFESSFDPPCCNESSQFSQQVHGTPRQLKGQGPVSTAGAAPTNVIVVPSPASLTAMSLLWH